MSYKIIFWELEGPEAHIHRLVAENIENHRDAIIMIAALHTECQPNQHYQLANDDFVLNTSSPKMTIGEIHKSNMNYMIKAFEVSVRDGILYPNGVHSNEYKVAHQSYANLVCHINNNVDVDAAHHDMRILRNYLKGEL